MESSTSTFTLLVIAVITILLVKFIHEIYKQLTYWKKRGVPYFPSVPVLGTGWKLLFQRVSFGEYASELYNAQKDAKYTGFMDFKTPTLVVRDPEIIKDVTVKNFDNFPDHRTFVDEKMDPIFGKNIFSLKGERWREMRNTLSPSFTASKMRFMFELISKCSHEFIDYLVEHPEFSTSMEAKDAFTRYTNDVIATAAFGISVNSMKDRNNEFFTRGKDVLKFGTFLQMVKFAMLRVAPSVARWLGMKMFPKKITGFFTTVVSETVRTRDEQGIVRPDMIHMLMQARDQNKHIDLTIEDMVAQAFIFFLAGFDTSSVLMCYTVHELAVHPDIQEKLREEVDEHLAQGNGELTYESMTKMEYMDMVLSEILRLYPPAPIADRACVKSFELSAATPDSKPVIVEPGTVLWMSVIGLHRDPQYFPEPDKFDPERFNEENKGNIHPYAYMPFGLGPRKCIGNRFALMETKIVIAHLLQKFIIKRTEKTKVPIVLSKKTFSMNAEGGFWIGLEKRTETTKA